MATAKELGKKQVELKQEVIKAIRNLVGSTKVPLTDIGKEFEDEANNTITDVDSENVYFDGTMENYPLEELGIDDALYILGVLEDPAA